MIRNKTGVWGEIYAARYLRDRGCDILSANFSSRFGEIDLVAEKDGIIRFVEVKTRNVKTKFRPMEAVDEIKMEKLRITARSYISYFDFEGEARFDVCEVYLDDNNGLKSINYIKNAF